MIHDTAHSIKMFRSILLLLMVAFGCTVSSVGQSINSVDKRQAAVQPDEYRFESSLLPDQVKEALQQGEQDYIGPIISLMQSHRSNPDEVLLLLKPHLKDANESTQYTIITAASLARTKQALEILSSLTADTSNGRGAAIAIYENFDCQQLNSWGGSQLKNALFRAAFKRRDAIETYLLLSCFKVDEKIVSFLSKRRESFAREKTKQNETNAESVRSIDRSQEAIALDLALIEMGKADALSRVNQIFSQNTGNEEELQSILRYLKFVKSKVILRQTIGLLKNKSVVIKIRNPDGTIHNTVRVCDLAYFSLGKRSGTLLKKYRYLDEVSLPHFSDKELAQAQEKFKIILKV